MHDQAEQRLGDAERDLARRRDRRRAAGDRRRAVRGRHALVGAEEQLVDRLEGVLERADRLVVHDEVRLVAQRLLAAADLAGHPPHGLDGLDAAGRHDQRLGGGRDHGAELLRVGLAGVHAVRPRARHDEVDLGQRVAEAGRLGHVLHLAEAALPGLQVDQVHDVGAVAEVGAVAAEVHGRLAGAVVDQEARRRRLARLLDEGGRHVDHAVRVLRAAAVEHDLLALLVEHDHADVGEDAEGRVVDAPLLLVGEEADATGADLLAAVCHGHS